MRETPELRTEIGEKRDELIKLLQDYCRSQAELWRQVPELAKEANKLNRFHSGRLHMAADYRLWSIDSRFLHGLQVDLQTGEINSGRGNNFSDIITLGGIDSVLARFDAAEIIRFLEKMIKVLRGDRTRRYK